MKYKKFRYNFIVLGLVAIISCCVAFPLITGGSETVNQGEVEEIMDIEDFEDTENNEESDEETDEDESDDAEDYSIYKSSDLINLSLEKLYKGKGFASTFTQTCANTVSSINMTVRQNATGTIVRNGNTSLQEGYYWSDYSGIGSEQTQNQYMFYYIDKDNNLLIDGYTKDYNKDARTYNASNLVSTTRTYEDGMAKWLTLYGDNFPIKTTKKDSIYSDKIVKNYREIKVRYNISSLSSKVKNFFGTTGQLTNINYSSLEVYYKINIKTGNMISITRIESLSGVNTATGFSASSTATTTHKFTSVDQEQVITCPGK